MEHILSLWIRRLSIAKTSVSLKLIHELSIIPIRIPGGFLWKLTTDSKNYVEKQRIWNSQDNFENEQLWRMNPTWFQHFL